MAHIPRCSAWRNWFNDNAATGKGRGGNLRPETAVPGAGRRAVRLALSRLPGVVPCACRRSVRLKNGDILDNLRL